jgi:hypothetical protein
VSCPMEDVAKAFWTLHEELAQSINSNTTNAEIEAGLCKILEFIKQHEAARPLLSECLREMVRNTSYGEVAWMTWELVPFCMRELQWPEIREEIKLRLRASQDHSEKRILRHMLEPFENPRLFDQHYVYYINKRNQQ